MYKKSKYTFDIPLLDNSGIILCNLLYNTKAVIPSSDFQLSHSYYSECIPDAEHVENPLLKNGFFVYENVDETAIAQKAISASIIARNRTLNITIKPTIACNLKCIYCWEADETGFMNEDTADMIIELITIKLARNEVDKVVINWFGGEPMLSYDMILATMDKIKAICLKHSVPFVGIMSTNGTLLTSERVNELLKRHVYSFQITVDGTKELHDVCRPFKSGKQSSYDVIIKNLVDIRDNVRQRFLEIIFRANVTQQFLNVKNDYYDLYKKNFGNDKRFSLLLEDVTDKGGERINLVKDKIFDDDVGHRDSLVNELLKNDIVQHNFMNYEHGSMMCNAVLRNSFNINYDGMIYYCELMSDKWNTCIANNRCHISTFIKNDTVIDPSIDLSEHLPDCNMCLLFPICCGMLCPLSIAKSKRCTYKNNIETIRNSLLMLYRDGKLPILHSI